MPRLEPLGLQKRNVQGSLLVSIRDRAGGLFLGPSPFVNFPNAASFGAIYLAARLAFAAKSCPTAFTFEADGGSQRDALLIHDAKEEFAVCVVFRKSNEIQSHRLIHILPRPTLTLLSQHSFLFLAGHSLPDQFGIF